MPAVKTGTLEGLPGGAMIASRHLVLAVAFGAACAGAQAPSPGVPAATAPAGAGTISGIVVNHQGVRLPKQIVAVGGRRTTSDGEGRFSLTDVPATYDLIVAKPDGDLVTIYQGIGRRDPRVVVGLVVADRRADRDRHHQSGGGAPRCADRAARAAGMDD